MTRHRVGALLWLAGMMPAPFAAAAPAAPLLRNPFNDPFVQATAGMPCAVPRGPAYTEAERRAEAHSRIERGTSCWLAGTCSEPNAYRYDAAIAERVVNALRAEPALRGAALWVTVQRRIVTLQGCVREAAQATRAERIAGAVADVQAVLPTLARPGEHPRYPVAEAADSPPSR